MLEWPEEDVRLCITKHGGEDNALRWNARRSDKEAETAVVTRAELDAIREQIEEGLNNAPSSVH